MFSLLQSLIGGTLVIVLAFVLLYRLTRLQAKESAVVTALAALAVYVPLAVLYWPGPDVFAIHLAIYLVVPYLLGIIGSQRDERSDPTRRWFHWGPALIVGFFMVVVAVNAVFIALAQGNLEGGALARWFLPEPRTGAERVQSVFPGTVAHDYQEKEALYNARLAALERQRERGWQVSHRWEGPLVAGRLSRLEVVVEDKRGEPVGGAQVHGTFLRPANSQADQNFAMTEVSPGVYRTEVSLRYHGHWDLLVFVERGDDIHEVQARMEVAPAEDA